MLDKLIDGALAGLIIGIIFTSWRFGLPLLYRLFGYLKMSVVRLMDKLHRKQYPIQSSIFPFSEFKYGDFVEIQGIGKCKYYGMMNGKYYIESCIPGHAFGNATFLYADKAYIEKNATKLSTSRIIKWTK